MTINVTVTGGADTRTDVSDSGSTVVSNVTDVNFDTNLSVSDDGDSSVTVTASSTSEGISGDATEIVDPADDVAGIQTAHDNLPSDGGTIWLRPGTYLTSTVVGAGSTFTDGVALRITKPNVTLRGAGWASEIKLEANSTNGTDGARLINVEADNCVLRDFTVNGNKDNGNTPTSGNDDGFNISSRQDGSNMLNPVGCIVTNVHSRKSTGDGIEFSGDESLIAHNYFYDNWEQHVHTRDGENFRVIGNHMELMTQDRGHINLNSFGTITNALFADNTIIGDGTTDAFGPGGAPGSAFSNIRFVDNIVDGTEQGVLWDQNVDGLTISDNTFVNTTGTTGSDIGFNGGTLDQVSVTDNVCRSANYRHVSITSAPTINRMKITDNNMVGAGNHGMRIHGGTEITVSDNDIYDADFAAIKIDGSPTDLMVENNKLKDPNRGGGTQSAILEAGSGATVLTVRDNLIKHDTALSSPYEHGVELGANGHSRVRIIGNEILNPNTNALNLAEAVAEIRDNTGPLATVHAGGGTTTAGGSDSPAARINGVIGGHVTESEVARYAPDVWVDTAPSFNADYALARPYLEWDDSAGTYDLVVPWQTDPGAGNDITIGYAVDQHAT